MKARNKSSKRLSTIPAIIAGLVIVCWPAFASAVCCCVPNGGVSISESVTQPACPHCLPQTEAHTPDSPSQPCGCGVGCRSNFAATMPPVTQADPDFSKSLSLIAVLDEFPRGRLVSSEIAIDVDPYFLLAQARCARICCWLK